MRHVPDDKSIRGAGRRPPLTLAYHGVADVALRDDPFRLFVRPRDLRAHIARLRRWGYTLTTFSDLARQPRDGYAALTFDDGLADNLHALVPVLRATNAPATVFVASGLLGGQHPDAPAHRMLTVVELAELAAIEGVEIGGHSRSHVDLTTMTYEQARQDVQESKAELESIAGRPVDVFAYPFGKANDAARNAVRDAGYVAACLTVGEGSWSDPFGLPRQAMNNRDTAIGMWLKRFNRYEQVMEPIRPLLRNPVGGRLIGLSRRARSVEDRLVEVFERTRRGSG